MTGMWISSNNVEAFLMGMIDKEELLSRRATSVEVMGFAMRDIGIAADGTRCVVTMALRKPEELP